MRVGVVGGRGGVVMIRVWGPGSGDGMESRPSSFDLREGEGGFNDTGLNLVLRTNNRDQF